MDSLPMCLRIAVPAHIQAMFVQAPIMKVSFSQCAPTVYVISDKFASWAMNEKSPEPSNLEVANAAALTKQALDAATAEELEETEITLKDVMHPSFVENLASYLPSPTLPPHLSALTSTAGAPPLPTFPAVPMEGVVMSDHDPIIQRAPVHAAPVRRKVVPVRAQSMRADISFASSTGSSTATNTFTRPALARPATGAKFDDFLSQDKVMTWHEDDNAQWQRAHAEKFSTIATKGLKTVKKQAIKQVTKSAVHLDDVLTDITAARHGHG
jgi:hypothetical protein